MKRLLLVVICFTLIFCSVFLGGYDVQASSGTYNGFQYYENANSVIIMGYNGQGGSVAIPSVINGKPVTEIGGGGVVFGNCSNLASITIPNSVTVIRPSAFEGCSSLTSVIIPDSVTNIGMCAFSGCSSLTSVTIPNINTIKENTFSGCSSLTSIIVTDGIIRISNSAFSDCSNLTSVTIPNSVTSIGDSAFKGCSSLTSIVIPDSVTIFSTSAFRGCSSLASITLSNNVTSIGEYAFLGCSSLKSVNIPNSVKNIWNYAFADCTSLTSITIPDTVITIGDSSFNGCSSLRSVIISNSAISISDFAFKDCSSLALVAIPNSVKYIGGSAFSNCSNIAIFCEAGSYAEAYAVSHNIRTVNFDLKVDSSIDNIIGTTATVVSGNDVFFKIITLKTVTSIMMQVDDYSEAYTASSQYVELVETKSNVKIWIIKRPFTVIGERLVTFKQWLGGWSEHNSSVTVTVSSAPQVKVGTTPTDANADSITIGAGSDMYFKVTAPIGTTRLILKCESYTEAYNSASNGVTVNNNVWTVYRPFSAIGSDRPVQFIPIVGGIIGTESVPPVFVTVVPVRVLDVKASADAITYLSNTNVNAGSPLYFKVVTDKAAQSIIMKVGTYTEVPSNVTSVIEGNTKIWTVTRPFATKGTDRVVEFKAIGNGTEGSYSTSVATVTVQ